MIDSGAVALESLDAPGTYVDLQLESSVRDASGKQVVVLRFTDGDLVDQFGSLVDGDYRLIVFSDQFGSQSGGTTEDPIVQVVHRLFGDYDGNGKVRGKDWSRFVLAYLGVDDTLDALFDFDNDGDTDRDTDLDEFNKRFHLV